MTVVSASAFAVGYVAGLRVCRVHTPFDFEEWSLELLSWGEGR